MQEISQSIKSEKFDDQIMLAFLILILIFCIVITSFSVDENAISLWILCIIFWIIFIVILFITFLRFANKIFKDSKSQKSQLIWIFLAIILFFMVPLTLINFDLNNLELWIVIICFWTAFFIQLGILLFLRKKLGN